MKIFEYLKHVRAELTHVVWPKTRQAAMHTLVIVLISIATALIVAALDYVFTTVVGGLISF